MSPFWRTFATFQRHCTIGYSLRLIVISRVRPEADASLTALTAAVSPSFTTVYTVCFSIFLKVSGFQPSGRFSPGAAVENLPTSRTAGESAKRGQGAIVRTRRRTTPTHPSPLEGEGEGGGLSAKDFTFSRQTTHGRRRAAISGCAWRSGRRP